MRKLKKGRKFSRGRDERKALLKSLMISLFLNEKIRTTEAKAKELARFSEKVITRAKRGNLSVIRILKRYFPENIVRKLVQEIGPRYKARKGGYLRIVKLGPRRSDAAKMAQIELIK